MKKLQLILMIIVGFTANAQISLGTGTTAYALPIHTAWNYSYSQQIYFKSEINANNSSNITGIKFHVKPNESISNSALWKIYIGHTSKTSFSSRTDWIPTTSMTEVFSGTVVSANGEITIIFATPFLYNNVDNLVVAVDDDSPGKNGEFPPFYVYSGAANNTVYKWSTTNINPVNFSNGTTTTSTKSRITFLGLTSANLSVSNVLKDKNRIKIYPNPVGDILNISEVLNVKSITVHDLSGRAVKSIVKPESEVNIKELQSGIYILTLDMNDGSKQIIKINKK